MRFAILIAVIAVWAFLVTPSIARNPRGMAVVITSGSSVINFAFVPPTQNTDNSTLTTGEVIGYELGLRTSGSAGTYPTVVELEKNATGTFLSTSIIPGLAAGTYFAAIRTTGPTPSAWSTETSFTIN